MKSSFVFFIFFICLNNCLAEDQDTFAQSDRREKTRQYCELHPIEEKCVKFLDSEYRRLKDAEKELKDEHELKILEQKYQRDKKTELISFCRKNPDSTRCKR